MDSNCEHAVRCWQQHEHRLQEEALVEQLSQLSAGTPIASDDVTTTRSASAPPLRFSIDRVLQGESLEDAQILLQRTRLEPSSAGRQRKAQQQKQQQKQQLNRVHG